MNPQGGTLYSAETLTPTNQRNAMKRLVTMVIGMLLGLVMFATAASAATNINTIDVSTNLNAGSSGCFSDYPQAPHADVSTWRLASSVANLGSGVTMESSVQPTSFRCYNSANAGWFADGNHVWITCYTFDSYYGGSGAMWLGVVRYQGTTPYVTFWPAKWQAQSNIAAQGVPPCTVDSANFVSPTGR